MEDAGAPVIGRPKLQNAFRDGFANNNSAIEIASASQL